MSDQDHDPTAFNVVDRRTGSQETPESNEEQAGSVAEDASQLNAAESESTSDSSAANSTPDSTDDVFDERSLPDAGFLLNMATMQMDARTLLQALIPIFDGFAWRSMGFIADPKTGETNKDMPGAQLAIDTVQFLLSKVEAQLSETERRDTHRRLSDLRMNYITKLREP